MGQLFLWQQVTLQNGFNNSIGGQFIWENGTLHGVPTTRLEVKSGGFVSIVSENDKVLSRLLTNSGTVLHQSSREVDSVSFQLIKK
jgi:hypothetical protein